MRKLTTKHKVYLFALVVLTVVLGFLREYVFLNINAQITYLEGYPYNFTHEYMQFLHTNEYSISTLVNIKWVMTILFSGLFLGLTILFTRLLFTNKRYVYWCLAVFLVLFIFSGLSYLIGNQLFNSYYGYRFARIFMGFLQSPVPIMILIPAFILNERSKR